MLFSWEQTRSFFKRCFVCMLTAGLFGHVAWAKDEQNAAKSPYDQKQAKRIHSLQRGSEELNILTLLEFWKDFYRSNVFRSKQLLMNYRKTLKKSSSLRAYVDAMAARIHRNFGRWKEADAALKQAGYIRSWQVVGPFDNDGKRGLDRVFDMEKTWDQRWISGQDGTSSHRALNMAGKDWRMYDDVSFIGYMDLGLIFRPSVKSCAYARTTISSTSDQTVSLWFGVGGAHRIWWNGHVIHENHSYLRAYPERYALNVLAYEGSNDLVIKVCADEGDFGFYMRLAGKNGRSLSGVYAKASEVGSYPGKGHVAELSSHPKTFLQVLENKVNRFQGKKRGRAEYDLARFLFYTGADESSFSRVVGLAKDAASRIPSLSHLIFSAKRQKHRSQLMKVVRRLKKRYPHHPQVLLLQAQMHLSGFSPLKGLQPLAQIKKQGTVTSMRAALALAALYKKMNFPSKALSIMEKLIQKAPYAPFFFKNLCSGCFGCWGYGSCDRCLSRAGSASLR